MKLAFKDSYLGKLRALVGTRPLIVPGFRIIMEDTEGRILLLKRSDDGLWGMPAGSPELGESLETCIRREVFEETGIKIRTFTVFGVASDPQRETHTYPNGDQIQNFSLLVCSQEWEGVPRVTDGEATEVRFFDPANFPAPELRVTKEFDSIPLYRKFRETGVFQCT